MVVAKVPNSLYFSVHEYLFCAFSGGFARTPNIDIFNTMLWVTLTHKLDGAIIQLDGIIFHKGGKLWADSTNVFVAAYIYIGTWADTTLEWYLENLKIKNIRISGKWTVSGLYCPDYFCEIYNVSTTAHDQMLKTNNNALKVYKHADAIVIKGAGIGEKINIYTNSGAPIKSIVANNELVTIKLPAKQVYLVNIGQTRYKVAL